jgi:hypothetical protein
MRAKQRQLNECLSALATVQTSLEKENVHAADPR